MNKNRFTNAWHDLFEWRSEGQDSWVTETTPHLTAVIKQDENWLWSVEIRSSGSLIVSDTDCYGFYVARVTANLMLAALRTQLTLEEETPTNGTFATGLDTTKLPNSASTDALKELYNRVAMWERQERISAQAIYDINDSIATLEERVRKIEAMGYPRIPLTQTSDWTMLQERIKVLEGNFSQWKGWYNAPASMIINAEDKARQAERTATDAQRAVHLITNLYDNMGQRLEAIETFLRTETLPMGDDNNASD